MGIFSPLAPGRNGRRAPGGGECMLVDAAAEIDRFLRSSALSEATRRAYRTDLDEFRDWLRRRRTPLERVDTRALTDYVAELGAARPGRVPRRLAPTTIARKLASVRSFLRFALGPDRVPETSLVPRRPRRLPETPRQQDVEAELGALGEDRP